MTTDAEDLQKEINAARKASGVDPVPVAEQPKDTSGDRKGASAGITMVASVMVCTFFGVAVDEWLHTKPLALIIFLLLGIASGFYTVYKASKGT